MLTRQQFQQAANLSLTMAQRWHSPIITAMTEFGIDTPLRQAAFISQVSVESAGFRRLRENLNYSIQGLLATFPKRVTVEQANQLGRKPGAGALSEDSQRKIANLVYGGRNGNEGPDDGWLYRGGGLMHVTFYDNYLRCGHALELDLIAQPELLTHDDLAARSAAWVWYDFKCNPYADKQDIVGLTRVINGGTNGLADRQAAYKRAYDALCR